jgi:hypothetical protein
MELTDEQVRVIAMTGFEGKPFPNCNQLVRSGYAAGLKKGIAEVERLRGVNPDDFDNYHDFMAALNAKWAKEWVPVAESMPEPNKWVLLWNGHWRGVGKFDSTWDEEYNQWQDEATQFITPAPTHWMLLPDPPAEAEDLSNRHRTKCVHCQKMTPIRIG